MNEQQNETISTIVLSLHSSSFMLRAALESIAAQTLPPCEILLVDLNELGSSFSRSLQEDAEHFPLVRVLPCPGLSKSEGINAAIQEARGDYYALSGAVEVWYPNKLQYQLAALQKNPDCFVAVCSGEQVETDGTIRVPPLTGTNIEDILFSDCYRSPSALLYRADAVKTAGGIDSAISRFGDLDLLVRLRDTGSIALMEERLYRVETRQLRADRAYQYFRELFYRQYERVAANRKLGYRYHTYLMSLAADASMWLEMAVHAYLAFALRPLHSLKNILRTLLHGLHILNRQLVLRSILRLRTALLRRRVLRYRHLNAGDRPEKRVRPLPQSDAPTQELTCSNETMQYAFHRKLHNLSLQECSVIREGCFAGCRELTRIVIPAHVRTIEAHAFQGCRSLTTIEFADGSLLSRIGAFAFADCSALTTLVLPGTVSDIGSFAFAGCHRLQSLYFRYYQQGEYSIQPEFPPVVSQIAEGTFAGCTQLRQLVLTEQNSAFRIGADAFSRCSQLTRFALNGKPGFVGDYAFAHCGALRELAVPYLDAVQYLGRGAFLHCRSLRSIPIPYALTYIQKYSFYGCAKLKRVKIPATVAMIDAYAFRKCADLATVEMQHGNTKYLPSTFEPGVQFTNQGEVPNS